MEGEVICTPLQVLVFAWFLTGPPATDDDGDAGKGNDKLRGSFNFKSVGNCTTELFCVPGCGGVWILADEVNVVKDYSVIRRNNISP